jgi:hypothetical protein
MQKVSLSLMDASASDSGVAPILQVAHTNAQVEPHVRTALQASGPCIALVGGTRAERQHTFGRILDLSDENALQFRAKSLVGERRKHTQNSLRKVFDSGAEERALLFIDGLDALLTWHHVDEPEEGAEDDAAPSTVEYFFQRVESYPYPVVLGVENAVHVEALRQRAPDLIVTHDGVGPTSAS